MAKKTFEIPVVFYVQAKSMKKAMESVDTWIEDLTEFPDGVDSANVTVVTEFDEGDDGQRVMYLHPATMSVEEFNGDDEEEEDDEDEDEEDEDDE